MARARRSPQSLRLVRERTRHESRNNGSRYAEIAQIQRARILSAMFDVASEQGAANVSVADVVERSGVSRRTFYESFGDREDCFLAAFEQALVLAGECVLPAYRSECEWRKQIRAGLIALLSFLEEEPVIGRLLIVESLSAGIVRMLERRDLVLARVAAAIEEGRAESASAVGLPALTAEGLVGGALSVIHTRLARPAHTEGRHRRDHAQRTACDGELSSVARGGLLDLANQLMSMIVLPYLGAAAARRELERPVEPRANGKQRAARQLVDPFKDAGMRLTYRTVRVLLAVAELGDREPGPSNRLIGETAGMTDQGQTSKLLARLERVGLISNTGLGPGQGAPNAWSLTPTGRQVVNSIRATTTKETR